MKQPYIGIEHGKYQPTVWHCAKDLVNQTEIAAGILYIYTISWATGLALTERPEENPRPKTKTPPSFPPPRLRYHLTINMPRLCLSSTRSKIGVQSLVFSPPTVFLSNNKSLNEDAAGLRKRGERWFGTTSSPCLLRFQISRLSTTTRHNCRECQTPRHTSGLEASAWQYLHDRACDRLSRDDSNMSLATARRRRQHKLEPRVRPINSACSQVAAPPRRLDRYSLQPIGRSRGRERRRINKSATERAIAETKLSEIPNKPGKERVHVSDWR